MKTKWTALSPHVYVRRDDDAIETYVTGDEKEPSGGNIVSTFRASVEQFADLIGGVSPDLKGKLVNVGTEKIPALVPQSVAPLITAIIVAGGADAMIEAQFVNVGDDANALLLTKPQSEVFATILVEAVHEQVEKAVADDRAAREAEAAALAKAMEATAVNVGADAGLKLLLQPGDAAIFKELVALAVQAALERAAAPA